MSVTSLRIASELKEEIEALARLEGKSAHAFMLGAIEEKVASERLRRAFLDEGLAAMADFERTGEAIDSAEMQRWLTGKAAGRKVAEPPRRKWRS